MSFNGIGYLGSPSIQVSTTNQEVIPSKPSQWTQGYKCYKFSFNNKQGVTVIINKESTIFLEAGQGFEMEKGDAPIFSFVIVESDINFTYIGAY